MSNNSPLTPLQRTPMTETSSSRTAPSGEPIDITCADGVHIKGHDVLVFDYRGIGLSLQGALKDCRASLQEWGQQDQVAAINWLVQRTGAKKVLLLGHSAGGQMIGLLPNHPLVARVVGVAASSGWFGGMAPGFRMASQTVLRGAIPVGIRL
jgi:predicted alpha/beta hydrolase